MSVKIFRDKKKKSINGDAGLVPWCPGRRMGLENNGHKAHQAFIKPADMLALTIRLITGEKKQKNTLLLFVLI